MEKVYTILITDDNPENIRILSKILKQENYKIRVATNGIQAINSVNAEQPDMVLMDIQMPEMDGYEACRRIKAQEENKNLPIIFISAISEIYNVLEAFKAGGVDYISKPFQYEEVLARIKTHLTLRQTSKELEDTLDKLRKTQSQLIHSEKMASLGQLTAGIAHEINNPVNFIQNSSYAMEKDLNELFDLIRQKSGLFAAASTKSVEGPDQGDQQNVMNLQNILNKEIENIKEGVRRTVEIVKGLQKFSYQGIPKKLPADLHQSIDTSIQLLNSRFDQQIELVKNYDRSIEPFNCQVGQLSQVFLNLFTNALDAMGEKKGKVVITTKNGGDQIIISVKDNGIGIPEEHLDKVFDPFFTTKPVGQGTGLGLSISHSIIKNHNGTIKVKSQEGLGSEFIIELPIS